MTIPDIEVIIQEVYYLRSKSNIYKLPGSDSIHLHFLKETPYEIHSAYANPLFKRSVGSKVVPNDWKKAYILPVHKIGDKTNPAN